MFGIDAHETKNVAKKIKLNFFIIFSVSEFCVQFNRAMVASKNFRVDFCAGHLVLYAVGNEEIVDPPACVLFAGMESVRPPAVDSGGFGVEVAEAVRES